MPSIIYDVIAMVSKKPQSTLISDKTNMLFFNLDALPIAEIELKIIAHAAIIGDSEIQRKGYKTTSNNNRSS